jgi:hypothetical protein
MVKSCALSAALLDLHHCGLSLVTQTMHKEAMRIKERKSGFSKLALEAEKLELARL